MQLAVTPRVCRFPARDQVRPDPPADWRCKISCRDRGTAEPRSNNFRQIIGPRALIRGPAELPAQYPLTKGWSHMVREMHIIPLIRRVVVTLLIGFGLGFGVAQAQVQPLGQIDTDCTSRCAAHGYDAEFCDRACWVPDPQVPGEQEQTDWPCVAVCLYRGGEFDDCKPRCKRG